MTGVLLRILPFQGLRDYIHFCLRSRRRNTWPEPGYYFEVVVIAVLEFLLSELLCGPHFYLAPGKVEIARHHSNDSVYRIVEGQVSSDNSGVAAERCSPEAITQQHGASG